MADSYDRYENEGSGGGFMMGLLTGTVLGAGLGMLLAPKAGSELRGAISEQARNFGSIASEGYRKASDMANEGYRKASDMANEGYRKASDTASGWSDKGREFVDRARDAVSRGAEEARGYAGGTTGSSYSSGNSSSNTGSSSFGGSNTSSNTGGTPSSDFGRS
jgi:gas vesicle protein